MARPPLTDIQVSQALLRAMNELRPTRGETREGDSCLRACYEFLLSANNRLVRHRIERDRVTQDVIGDLDRIAAQSPRISGADGPDDK